MIRIELRTDIAAFQRAADEHVTNDVVEGLVDAVNDVAKAAEDRLVDRVGTVFDNPTPFTRNSFRVLQANARRSKDPAALLYIQQIQARYLELEIEGGVRRAGDYATTKLGPIVPGPHAPKDSYGNLPRGYVRKIMQEKHVAWINARPGQPPILVRSVPGKKMEVLAVITRDQPYKPVLPFYAIVEETVRKEWPRAAERALARRLT